MLLARIKQVSQETNFLLLLNLELRSYHHKPTEDGERGTKKKNDRNSLTANCQLYISE